MAADRPELTGVAGVPESALGDQLVARLPGNPAPAPWTAECEAVVWLHRGGRAARHALAPALRVGRALAVVGGLVRYGSTPAGAYGEVLGLVASHERIHPWGSVAFMAVDSEASLVGGRTNWAMPKSLAAFDGELASGMTRTATGSEGLRWRVSVTPRAFGPRLPVAARSTNRQEFPDGRVGESRLRGRGRVRLAVVTVEVESDGPLPAWLRPGRHLGVVVETATFSLAPPSFR